MPSIVQLWKSTPALLEGKTVQQIVAICGSGKLRDAGETSSEFRELLSVVTSENLAAYAAQCLEEPFAESGIVLQDIINQIGTRLGFAVTPGRYRGSVNQVGFDGLWKSLVDHTLLVEVKTTDAYRINLDTIAGYRTALISDGQLAKDCSSILIVVGRQDTGDLEAQIRGSRHAWDIRLISTDALLKLMSTKQKLNDWGTSQKINELLKPMEYTRVDPIIDLIFTTSEDITDDDPREADPTDVAAETANAQTSIKAVKAATSAIRNDAVERISRHLDRVFVRKGFALFSSSDGKTDLVCLASQAYSWPSRTGYWFGFTPGEGEFLKNASEGYVAFAVAVLNASL